MASHDTVASPEMDSDAQRADIFRLPHVSTGHAGDGHMYRDGQDRRVKIDKAGRPYPVGADGWRIAKTSGRPEGMDPDTWAMLRPLLVRENKTYEQFLAESTKPADPVPAVPARFQEAEHVSVLEIFAGSARISAS